MKPSKSISTPRRRGGTEKGRKKNSRILSHYGTLQPPGGANEYALPISGKPEHKGSCVKNHKPERVSARSLSPQRRRNAQRAAGKMKSKPETENRKEFPAWPDLTFAFVFPAFSAHLCVSAVRALRSCYLSSSSAPSSPALASMSRSASSPPAPFWVAATLPSRSITT
jgi:hypothetical protein